MQDERDSRRQQLMAAIAKRLVPVRGQMTDAEFGALLADMVRTAERFEAIDAKPGAHRPDMSPEDIQRLLDNAP